MGGKEISADEGKEKKGEDLCQKPRVVPEGKEEKPGKAKEKGPLQAPYQMAKGPGVKDKRNSFCFYPDKSLDDEVCAQGEKEVEKEEAEEQGSKQQEESLSAAVAFRRKKEREPLCAEHKEGEMGKVEKLLREAKGRGKREGAVQPGKEGIITPHSQREGENKQDPPEEPLPLFSLPEEKESSKEREEPNVYAEEPGDLPVQQGLKPKLPLRAKESAG